MFNAVPDQDGTRSEVFVVLNLDKREVIIGGTDYAGEIKKSILTVMTYVLPPKNVLPMHCSANYGKDENDLAGLLTRTTTRESVNQKPAQLNCWAGFCVPTKTCKVQEGTGGNLIDPLAFCQTCQLPDGLTHSDSFKVSGPVISRLTV